MNKNPFMGLDNMVFATGVVEDINDPLTIGRVRVRWFGFHPEDRDEVPTIHLPWAQVMQPTNSASISGIGWSPNGLLMGSWVFGFFMDGKNAQYPVVLGTWAGIHKPNSPDVMGGSNDEYNSILAPNQYHGMGFESDTYNPQNMSNLPDGTAIKDDGTYLTKNMSNWPLQTYSKGDLQCRGTGKLQIHHATCVALEKLTKEYGRGKLTLNSAYRSPEHNRNVGGARNSLHVRGRAFDISYASIGGRGQAAAFAQYAVRCGFVGFGLYNTFIHIDTGTGRVWEGAKSASFVAAIKQAGWYQGKKGLDGIKVDTSQQKDEPANVQNAETVSSGTQPQNEAEAVERINRKLDAAGYTSDHQKAAVLGTIKQESNFNSSVENSIGAFGLNQWLGSRRDNLNSYAASQGKSPSDFDTQVDFMIMELDRPDGMGAGKALRNSTDLNSSMAAMNRFERFNGWKNGRNGLETGKRYTYAEQYLGGYSGSSERKIAGFQDPTNSFPYNEYRGLPSTNYAARGLNGTLNQPSANNDAARRVTSVPIGGDTGTFGEPPVAYNAKYPYNKTYSTASGHLIEYDDSPDSERINIMHRTGSKFEMSAKGTVHQKNMGNYYNFTMSDSFSYTDGDYYNTAQGNINQRSTSDMVLHADGSFNIISGNDKSEIISGNVETGVGGKWQIKVGKLIIEANSIDLYSESYINMEAEDEINIKTKALNIQTENSIDIKTKEFKQLTDKADIKSKDLTIQGDTTGIKGNEISIDGSTTNVKGNTINIDPAGSMNIDMGGAKSVSDAAEAKDAKPALSTAIGKIPERSVIQKSVSPKENPDSYDGFDEGFSHYTQA